MWGDLWILALPSIAIAVNMAAQIASYQLRKEWGLLGSLLAGFGLGLLVLIGLTAVNLDGLDQVVANFVLYGGFGYVYFHFNNMGETARRVRLVRELDRVPEGLNMGELLARYAAREVIDRRIGRLLASGQIVERDGRLHLGNPSVLAMARMVGVAKRLVHGRRAGFNHFAERGR